MTVYIALLRAVNVGGTGKLPMAELRNMCQDIGFADAEPSRTLTYLLDRQPVSADLHAVSNRLDEELALGQREIYIYYPSGIGRSKLKIPAAATATARNMNTLRKLVALSAD